MVPRARCARSSISLSRASTTRSRVGACAWRASTRQYVFCGTGGGPTSAPPTCPSSSRHALCTRTSSHSPTSRTRGWTRRGAAPAPHRRSGSTTRSSTHTTHVAARTDGTWDSRWVCGWLRHLPAHCQVKWCSSSRPSASTARCTWTTSSSWPTRRSSARSTCASPGKSSAGWASAATRRRRPGRPGACCSSGTSSTRNAASSPSTRIAEATSSPPSIVSDNPSSTSRSSRQPSACWASPLACYPAAGATSTACTRTPRSPSSKGHTASRSPTTLASTWTGGTTPSKNARTPGPASSPSTTSCPSSPSKATPAATQGRAGGTFTMDEFTGAGGTRTPSPAPTSSTRSLWPSSTLQSSLVPDSRTESSASASTTLPSPTP